MLLLQLSRGGDEIGETVRRLRQDQCFGWSFRGCGFDGGRFGQRLRGFRLGGLRRDGINTTPAGSGGKPAVVQSSSAHACRWALRPTPSLRTGVQEARTSTSASGESSAIPPKDSLDTDVTVPLGSTYSAPWLSSASMSQDQPTRARSGSVTISGSTVARVNVTQRKVPRHAAFPAGIVQQDETAAADLLSGHDDVGGDGGRERGDPLRSRHLLDEQLGPPGRLAQILHGATEGRRGRCQVRVDCHPTSLERGVYRDRSTRRAAGR